MWGLKDPVNHSKSILLALKGNPRGPFIRTLVVGRALSGLDSSLEPPPYTASAPGETESAVGSWLLTQQVQVLS